MEEDAPVLLELDEAGVEHAMTALSTTILAFKAVGVMLMCPIHDQTEIGLQLDRLREHIGALVLEARGVLGFDALYLFTPMAKITCAPCSRLAHSIVQRPKS